MSSMTLPSHRPVRIGENLVCFTSMLAKHVFSTDKTVSCQALNVATKGFAGIRVLRGFRVLRLFKVFKYIKVCWAMSAFPADLG